MSKSSKSKAKTKTKIKNPKPAGKGPRGVKVLSSRTVFRGRVFNVVQDRVREPGGFVAHREIVRHPGSVVVLAVDERRRVLLERQYRHAAGANLWELPAGKIDAGESELQAAKRELMEETGWSAQRWKLALRFYVSPGFLDETMAIFLATSLRAGRAQPEEDEKLRTRFFPMRQAMRMARNGTIDDAKTVAAIFWLALAAKSGGRRARRRR